MDKGTLLDRMGVTGDDRLLLAKTLDRAERALTHENDKTVLRAAVVWMKERKAEEEKG